MTSESSSWKRFAPQLQKGGVMVAARVIALVFGAAGSIWAARCLGPENLGLSGFMLGISVQIVLALSILHQTILVREYKLAPAAADRQAILTAATSFYAAGAVFISLAALTLKLVGLVPPPYEHLLGLLLVLVMATALQPNWLFQAAELQQFQSAVAILQPALQGSLYWLILRPGMGAGIDLTINAAVTSVVTALYWATLYRKKLVLGFPLSFASWRQALSLLAGSRWYFAISLAVYIYTSLELPLVGWLRSLTEMGQFRTAFTLTGAAKSLLEIVPMILYPRFIEWRLTDEELLWRRQNRIVYALVPLSVTFGLAAFYVTPLAYDLLYGPAYAGAALPCALLICSKLAVVVNGIYFWGLAADPRYDRRVAFCMIGVAMISLAGNFFFIPSYGMWGAASVDLASELIILIVCATMASSRIKEIRRKTSKNAFA